MKILDILAPYINGRVLLLGDPERLSNPEWLQDRKKEYEKREPDHAALDFIRERCEILTDFPGFDSKHNFDLVIDADHLAQEIDVLEDLERLSGYVAKGGVIFHLSPLSMLNWGYYNICPKLFEEFYKDWEILEKWAIKKEHAVPLPMDRASIASEVSMIWMARK